MVMIVLDVCGEWRCEFNLTPEIKFYQLKQAIWDITGILNEMTCDEQIIMYGSSKLVRVYPRHLSEDPDMLLSRLRDGDILTINYKTKDFHPLHQAAAYNKTEAMRKWISSGVSVDVRDGEGLTPLMRATRATRLHAVTLLLKSGADVLATDNEGSDALFHIVSHTLRNRRYYSESALQNSCQIIEKLIEAGANLSPKTQKELSNYHIDTLDDFIIKLGGTTSRFKPS